MGRVIQSPQIGNRLARRTRGGYIISPLRNPATGGGGSGQNLVATNTGRIESTTASLQSGSSNQHIYSYWVQLVTFFSNTFVIGGGLGPTGGDNRWRAGWGGGGADPAVANVYQSFGTTSASNVFNGTSTTVEDGTQLHHVLVSRVGTTVQLYVDDVVQTWGSASAATAVAFQNFSAFAVGSQVGSTGQQVVLGDAWFYAGQSLDLSVEANRRLFINADLTPADLGPNGEIPIGTTPDVYMGGSMNAADWNAGTNLGTATGFALVGSAFTDV